MDCNGKCALKKQLKAASKEKDESKEDFELVQNYQFSAFLASSVTEVQHSQKTIGHFSFVNSNVGQEKQPFLEIEHPPC